MVVKLESNHQSDQLTQHKEYIIQNQCREIRNLTLKMSVDLYQTIWKCFEQFFISDGQDMQKISNYFEIIDIIQTVRINSIFLRSQLNLGPFYSNNPCNKNEQATTENKNKDSFSQFSMKQENDSFDKEDEGKLKKQQIIKILEKIGQTCLILVFVLSIESFSWVEAEEICSLGINKYGLESPELISLLNNLKLKFREKEDCEWKGENFVNLMHLRDTKFQNNSEKNQKKSQEQIYENLLHSWQIYENTNGFIFLCLQLKYLEEMMFQWKRWFNMDSDCIYSNSLNRLLFFKSQKASNILESLAKPQQIKVIKDMRMLLHTCQKNKKPKTANNNSAFQRRQSNSGNKSSINKIKDTKHHQQLHYEQEYSETDFDCGSDEFDDANMNQSNYLTNQFQKVYLIRI